MTRVASERRPSTSSGRPEPVEGRERVVIDASALAAMAFGEPDGKRLAERLDGATVFAPTLLTFELANTAWKKARRHPELETTILRALAAALAEDRGIIWQTVPAADVALVALALGCSAYDAAYVWLAGSLGADLVTLDGRLSRLTAALAA